MGEVDRELRDRRQVAAELLEHLLEDRDEERDERQQDDHREGRDQDRVHQGGLDLAPERVVLLELVEKPLHTARSGLHVFEANPVNARGSVVCPNPLPCRLEDVTSVGVSVQRIEPKRRFLLGLSA